MRRKEWFADKALVFEARRRMQKLLEIVYEAGEMTEEAVLDKVLAPEKAETWIRTGKEKGLF